MNVPKEWPLEYLIQFLWIKPQEVPKEKIFDMRRVFMSLSPPSINLRLKERGWVIRSFHLLHPRFKHPRCEAESGLGHLDLVNFNQANKINSYVMATQLSLLL